LNGISVVIPAFNAAATLEETLASVMSQTRPPNEVIVVDDGSSDATSEIARGMRGAYVLRQANGGVASALNTGLLACHFSHIAFLDADDLWLPTCLETHEKHLEALPGLDASVGWVGEFVCPALPPSEARRLRPRPAQPGWLYGATLQRRDVFEQAGLFNPLLRFGAWIDWVDRARHAGVVFGVIEQLVLRRRLHPDSLSANPGAAEARQRGLLSVARLALARRRPGGQ
jgi:glycosyltransferase involved in cell wall biosynthesis